LQARWLLVFIVVLAPAMLSAESYLYLDANGVYTITNVPPPDGAAVIKELDDDGTETTYGPLGMKPVTPPELYEDHIQATSREHGIDPALVKAVIWVESCYNPRAVSNKGARGLMQLLPATARRFGVTDIFDPSSNITGGVKYLRFLLDLFNENTTLSLAAYNSGEETVHRYNGVPPYRETKDYVAKIARIYGSNLQAAVRTPIYRVDDGSGHPTFTNVPPQPGRSKQKAELVLK